MSDLDFGGRTLLVTAYSRDRVPVDTALLDILLAHRGGLAIANSETDRSFHQDKGHTGSGTTRSGTTRHKVRR